MDTTAPTDAQQETTTTDAQTKLSENRQIANQLFYKGKTDKAIEAFKKCVAECPSDDHGELSILNNNLGIAFKK